MGPPTEPIGCIPRRDRVPEAAEHILPERLGTCDDCGFAPFGDDTSTSRDRPS